MHSEQQDDVVLVTGGSGFLGQHVVRELQLHDPKVREIRVLDLVPYVNRLGHEETKPVLSLVGDVARADTCREAFRGVNCVIHVAALVSYAFPADEVALELNNVEGTQHVLQLCQEEGVSRLVFCCTAEVALRPRFLAGTFPLIVGQNELRALPPNDLSLLPPYVASKLRAERLVLIADMTPLDNGPGFLRTVSLRPTLLYGELEPRLVRAAVRASGWLDGALVAPTAPGGRQQFCYAGNAAWALVLAKDSLRADRADSLGGLPVFVTDDTCVDHAFVLAERVAGPRVRASAAWLPALVTYPLAMLAETIASVLRLELPVHPTALVSFLGGLALFSRLRAALHLRYAPQYSEQEAVERTKAYFAPLLDSK